MSSPTSSILRSTGRIAIALAVVIVIMGFFASQFLGPGLGDFTKPIINGYEYIESGGDEKLISLKTIGIVIDARVDEYRVAGDLLVVARRPREPYMDGIVAKSKMKNTCELLIIYTKKHEIINQGEKVHYGSCSISQFDDVLSIIK